MKRRELYLKWGLKMWNSINKLTSSIAQQAAELAQEVGLDEQIVRY